MLAVVIHIFLFKINSSFLIPNSYFFIIFAA